jgi:hypothetical protein
MGFLLNDRELFLALKLANQHRKQISLSLD